MSDRRRDEETPEEGRLRPVSGRTLEPVRDGWRALRRRIDEHRKWSYPTLAVLAIGLAAILPLIDDWVELPNALQRATSTTVLSRVALFALFALGLNVVVGFAGLLDLGYVAFWAIGSYTAGILTGAAEFTKQLRDGTATVADSPEWMLWMWGLLLVVLVIAILTGIVLGSPTLRLRGDYLAIVTLGFGEIIQITANNLDSITLGPRGITSIPRPEIHAGPVDVVWENLLDNKYYWLLLTFVVLWVIAITLLDRSRIGRAWASIREDEVAAASMGVPVLRMKLAAFAIGACTAGVGGVIYAEQVTFINPQTFDVLQSILILTMVVIGGMGSIPGAILGAAAVVVLPEVFRDFEDYRFFAFGIAIVVLMIFRPQGIIPSKRRKAELRGGVREAQAPALVAEAPKARD